MSNWFVDTNLGTGNNDGTTTDHAWRGATAIKTAMEFGGFTPGETNRTWIKRDCVEIPVADIAPTDDGAAGFPIIFLGWPRAAIPNTTITQADWTNGSNLVDNVVGITPTRTKHLGRYATGPDGQQYLITAILWEFTIDGMAGGAEFAVGEILTNTTQTKKGKVWAFTDNLDATGTIQAAVDSSTTWVDNDNITSDGGGDAKLDVNATAVGFLIDREYASSTVTGTDGKFQIEADEDYATAQAIDDSGWTIKLSTWTDDADDLPVVDFNDGAFQVKLSGDDYYIFKNLEFKDSGDSGGNVYIISSKGFTLIGCLFYQNQNTRILRLDRTKTYIERTIFEGSGTGASQRGIDIIGTLRLHLKNCAIYNCGHYGIADVPGAVVFSENVNIGIEMSNSNVDLYLDYSSMMEFFGRDVYLGGANGYVGWGASAHLSSFLTVAFENYQKVLGVHKAWFPGGTWESAAVSGETPNLKRSTTVIKITPDQTGYEFIEDWAVAIFTHEFEATTDAKTYKYWLYNDAMGTLNATAKADIWLKAEYVSAYDNVSEYVINEKFSTETSIASAADADDWDFLSVANVQPAVPSKVRITCYISKYHATGKIYIDPAEANSGRTPTWSYGQSVLIPSEGPSLSGRLIG